MKVATNTLLFFLFGSQMAEAFLAPTPARQQQRSIGLDMAQVGIFFGTSTGNTQTVAELIYETFGEDMAAEPIDVDGVEEGQLSELFDEHDALVVGTPTWNTGADTERSGTGWDELYYKKLPKLKSKLEGKKVAVFGLGDQVSYSENYADGTGELHDVFESLGCQMLGQWSQEGYEHENSKSIRGDKFCGLLLDQINQEELTEGRVKAWVAQLIDEGILSGEVKSSSSAAVSTPLPTTTSTVSSQVNGVPVASTTANGAEAGKVGQGSSGGFIAYTNPVSGKTLWVSKDGRQSYVTNER